ncbi:hypothetical protein SDC9_83221 [bioreactor metagenome]|uniref:Uncharacterized protein n=1 Tax=bioreactor metagenome TaxID=1076179 RepID=A0A644Z739_9ZZZZ
MTIKDNNYRNFSNRAPFNNIPAKADEELVPVVLTKEMKETLKPLGFDSENVETWTFPHGKKVPVVSVPNKKGFMDVYMKFFYSEVERYLKRKEEVKSEDLSLDKFLEDIDDEDGNGFDPTGTTALEDEAFLMQVFDMLVADLSAQDENMGKIIRLLSEGFQKKEILDKLDIGKGKTQGYAFIEKTQKIARDIYNSKYRW